MRSRSSLSTSLSLSFRVWLDPQLSLPAGENWKLEMVAVVRFQNLIPLPCAASSPALANNSATKAKIHRIRQSSHGGTLGAVIPLSDGRDFSPCRNFLPGRGQLERSTSLKRDRHRRNRCR